MGAIRIKKLGEKMFRTDFELAFNFSIYLSALSNYSL